MQKVDFVINHLTGRGWQDLSGTITVDETIGINAGKDKYATARGTVKKLIRLKTICAPATRARVIVDDAVVISIWLENKNFCHNMVKIEN